MRKPILITFGDGDLRFRRAARRIVREAQATNLFDQCLSLDFKWFRDYDETSFELASGWLRQGQVRGAGYWLWKSLIFKWAAEVFPGRDIQYLDAGLVIKPGQDARKVLESWIIEAQDLGGLAFNLPRHLEIEWCKREILEYLDPAKQFWYTNQIESCFIFLTANRVREFGEEWHKASIFRNGYFLTDALDEPQFEEFIENRHDQSIFSLLWKQFGYFYKPAEGDTDRRDQVIVKPRHLSGFDWNDGRRSWPMRIEWRLGKIESRLKY